MNAGPILFLASFFALATSWFGFVLMPQLQIGRQQPVVMEDTGLEYPPMRAGMARQGEQVYRASGCFYCHTEQVRPKGFGTDVERGWGGRPGVVQSVAQDYLYDQPAMLGTQRVGPDLANYGVRQTNEMVILKHLYDPRATMPGSVMPPYRYLFYAQKLKPGEKPSPDAFTVRGKDGYQFFPKDDARQLAAYLMSLHSQAILFETPPPPAPPTNTAAKAAATNAPAPATNAPTK